MAMSRVPGGFVTWLAKLSETLAKLDTLTQAERLQLLAGWEQLGARYRTIHALLLASLNRPVGSSSPLDDASLLTVPEVAARLRVSRSRVYQLLRSKGPEALASVKIGERQVRVSRSALQAYLKQVTEKEPQS
jgi:excisionase family DNA binding protein